MRHPRQGTGVVTKSFHRRRVVARGPMHRLDGGDDLASGPQPRLPHAALAALSQAFQQLVVSQHSAWLQTVGSASGERQKRDAIQVVKIAAQAGLEMRVTSQPVGLPWSLAAIDRAVEIEDNAVQARRFRGRNRIRFPVHRLVLGRPDLPKSPQVISTTSADRLGICCLGWQGPGRLRHAPPAPGPGTRWQRTAWPSI